MLFFFFFNFKSVVDFANFTYKCFYFTLTYHLRHRKVSVLELGSLHPCKHTRPDKIMKCTSREDQGMFENVLRVDSGGFSDASPGYFLFWEKKLGHERRNLVFVLVYKIISLQSSGFYCCFLLCFPTISGHGALSLL